MTVGLHLEPHRDELWKSDVFNMESILVKAERKFKERRRMGSIQALVTKLCFSLYCVQPLTRLSWLSVSSTISGASS